MPKFLLTFFILLAVSIASLVRTVVFSSPDQSLNLVVFFVCLFFLLFSVFSIFTYFITSIQVRESINRKSAFRRRLFVPFFVSLGMVVIGVLKIIDALNPLNLVLLVTLVIFFLFSHSQS